VGRPSGPEVARLADLCGVTLSDIRRGKRVPHEDALDAFVKHVCVLWSVMPCLCFFVMSELLALGEQVEQPLQLGGAGVQVRGEFCPGLFRAAVQRVQ
jgi:hypothetical protein